MNIDFTPIDFKPVKEKKGGIDFTPIDFKPVKEKKGGIDFTPIDFTPVAPAEPEQGTGARYADMLQQLKHMRRLRHWVASDGASKGMLGIPQLLPGMEASKAAGEIAQTSPLVSKFTKAMAQTQLPEQGTGARYADMLQPDMPDPKLASAQVAQTSPQVSKFTKAMAQTQLPEQIQAAAYGVGKGMLGIPQLLAGRKASKAAGEIAQEHPIVSGVGELGGTLLTLFPTGGLFTPLASKAYLKLLLKGKPAAARFIPRAVQSGATFGSYNLLREASRQVQEGVFEPGKLAEETGKGTAWGATVGMGGSIANSVKRVIASGVGAGVLTALDNLRKDGKVNPSDITFSTALIAGFTALNAPRVSKAMRDGAIRDLTCAYYAKLKKEHNVSDSVATVVSRNLAQRDVTSGGKTITIGEMERITAEIIKKGQALYQQYGVNHNITDIVKPDVMRAVGGQLMVRPVGGQLMARPVQPAMPGRGILPVMPAQPQTQLMLPQAKPLLKPQPQTQLPLPQARPLLKPQPTLPGIQEKQSVYINEVGKELSSINRAFNAGKKFSRDQVKDIQTRIIEKIEQSGIPAEKRGRFLRLLKNIQTPKQLEKYMPEMIKRFNNINVDGEKRVLAGKIKKLAKVKNIPADYKDKISEIMAGVDPASRTGKTVARRESLSVWLKRQQDEGELTFLPKGFWADLPRKTLDDMTIEEIRDLHNVTKILVHTGRTKNKLLGAREQRDLEQFVDDVVRRGYAAIKAPVGKPPSHPLVRKRETKIQKTKEMVSGYFAEHRKPEFILDHFKAGRVWDIMQNSKNAREKNKLMLKLKYKNLLRNIKNSHAKETHIPGVDTPLTREQIVGVALNSQNPGNLERLTEGNGFTLEEIKKINDALTPAEKRFVDGVFDLMEEQYPVLRDVTQKLAGYTPPKVEGKYFPIIPDYKLSKEAQKIKEAEDLFKEVFQIAAVERGFTKARVGGKDPVNLNVVDLIWRHLQKVNHYNHMALPVRDLRKIIKHPDFRQMVVDGLGEDVYGNLPFWLQTVANPMQQTGEGMIDNLCNLLRYNATAASLGFRLTTALYQPFSLTLTANEIGLKNTLEGVNQFIRNPGKAVKFVHGKSIQMKNRSKSWDREIGDLVRTGIDRKLVEGKDYREMLFSFIHVMDLGGAIPSWLGAYQKMLNMGKGAKAAVAYADKVVRKTQPTGAKEDLPKVMQGRPFKKAWTMFMSHFTNMHNNLVSSWDRARIDAKDRPFKSKADFFRAYLYIVVIPAMATEYIRRGGRWDSKKMAQAVMTYPLGGLLAMRDIANALVYGFDMEPPILGGPKYAGYALKTKNWGKKMLYGLKAAGQLTGKVPTQAVDSLRGMYDLLSGQTEDFRRLIWSAWALQESDGKKGKNKTIPGIQAPKMSAPRIQAPKL